MYVLVFFFVFFYFFFLLCHFFFFFFFFFSSRRRHTRSLCDWSSDGALPIFRWRDRPAPRRAAARRPPGRCATSGTPLPAPRPPAGAARHPGAAPDRGAVRNAAPDAAAGTEDRKSVV